MATTLQTASELVRQALADAVLFDTEHPYPDHLVLPGTPSEDGQSITFQLCEQCRAGR